VHRFTRAVSVGNPREFLQAEKEDQEMAEACKRLIKNCIICWNYLYLSQKLEEITDTESREALLTRWPTARRLPGGTSTCSASMISRQKSCGTASGSGSQN
jgi:Tn3 transposase DDE domain